MEYRDLKTTEDWNETGYLHGLDKESKVTIVNYLNTVLECIKDDSFLTLALPFCVRVWKKISDSRKKEKLFPLFDMVELCEYFNTTYPKVLNLKIDSVLANVDIEMYILIGMTDDYVYGLSKRIKAE